MSAGHTLTPWTVAHIGHVIVDTDGKWIADTVTVQRAQEEEQANASHIVRAVNSHDQLVAALQKVKDHSGLCSKSTFESVCAALAAAGA